MGAQKNRLIEMVLLKVRKAAKTHKLCIGWKIRKLFICYAVLAKVPL